MSVGAAARSAVVRFAVFELDMRSGELRKRGVRLKLEGQPLLVLQMLLERPGEVVSREELKQKLWPADTFVDFETSINAAVKRLRQALDDSAETPRFIETLPRRGYRFIYPLDPQTPEVKPAPPRGVRRLYRVLSLLVVIAGIAGIAVAAYFWFSRPSTAPQPAIASVAVLPLENLTGDPEQEYLADGVHDELITRLAQISGLKVTSRTSVVRYKQGKKALPEIARELKVTGVVEGSIRQVGGRIRMTAQLIHAPTDQHVWASVYDRDTNELPALPGEIARAIAGQLNIPLSEGEINLLGKQSPVDPEVYRGYLKASYFEHRWTPESLEKAVAHYQQAIEKDPNYAPAWAGMGTSLETLWRYRKDEKTRSRSKAALLRALELDNNLRVAHQALARLYLWEWDWTGVERHFRRAQEVDPNWNGPLMYLALLGRFDEAIRAGQQDVERDPLNFSVNLVLGWTYSMARRHDEAIAQLKNTLELEPHSRLPHYQLAWNYVLKGMHDEAVAECDSYSLPEPELAGGDNCGWVYAVAGRRDQALDFLNRVKTYRGDAGESLVAQAKIYDALGEREKAIRALYQAYEKRAPELVRLKIALMYSEALRADPRFQDLVRRMGFPETPTALLGSQRRRSQ